MKSVEQHYAEQALKSVRQVQEQSKFSREYGQLCRTFPSMVMVNGLRLTIAFFSAKGTEKDDEQEGNKGNIYKEVVVDSYKIKLDLNNAHGRYLIDLSEALKEVNILELDRFRHPTDYRVHTMQALQAAKWFKRYAEAILIDKEDQK